MDTANQENRDPNTPPRLLSSLNPVPGSFKPRARLLTMRPKRNSLLCVKKTGDSNFVQPLKAADAAVCVPPMGSIQSSLTESHSTSGRRTQHIRRFLKRVSVHFSQPQCEREPDSELAKRASTRFSFNSWRRRKSLAHDNSTPARDRSPLKTRLAIEEQSALYRTCDSITAETNSSISLQSDTSGLSIKQVVEPDNVAVTGAVGCRRSGKRRSLWNFSYTPVCSPAIGSTTKGTIVWSTGSDRSSPNSSVASLCPDSSEQLFVVPDPNLTPRPPTTPYPCKRKCTVRSRPSIGRIQRKRRSTLRPDIRSKCDSVELVADLEPTNSEPLQSTSDTERTLRLDPPCSVPSSDASRPASPALSLDSTPRTPIANRRHHAIPIRRDIRGRRLTTPNPFLSSSPAGQCDRLSHSSFDLNSSSTWTLDKPHGQDSGLSSEVSTSSAHTVESTDFTTEHEEEEEEEGSVDVDEESDRLEPPRSPPPAHKYGISRGSGVKSTAAAWTNRLRQSLDRAGRRCRLLAGRTLFNRNPKEGIDYLLEHGLVPRVPVAIARFLFNETELSRQAIGEYFGMLTDNLASEVLREYLQLLNMKGLQVDEALRLVLSHFHPVGESQKISYLMQVFQETYTVQNLELVADQFRNAETIEVLAYSILLLHTDLHNPNVRRLGKRMTKPEFVSNNRGLDAGEDLPVEMLQAIYDRVAAAQFKTIPDPFDRLRALDPMLTGPLKTDNFLQRHRRFVGWAAAHQVDQIVSRRSPKRPHSRLRHLLVFNDILIVAKLVTSGSLLNLAAAAAMGEALSSGNAAASRRKSLPTDRIVEHRLRPQSHANNNNSNAVNTTSKVYYSTEPMTTGTYNIRIVLPLVDLRVLVFESQYHQFGVQLCNNTGPIINLNLVSGAARQALIDWLHSSIAEMTELRSYHRSKTESRRSADTDDAHPVQFQTRL